MRLYELQQRVKKGDNTHEDFFNEFQLVFGNSANPSSEEAAHGCGKNYFKEFQIALEEAEQNRREAGALVKSLSMHHSGHSSSLHLSKILEAEQQESEKV